MSRTVGFFDLLIDFPVTVTRRHHVLGNLFLHPRNFLRQIRDSLQPMNSPRTWNGFWKASRRTHRC
jgi:hypothetical protein